ncbi:Sugar lactone lactonase YvrE [Thalassovita taeanensis]|uniref:Sugar lactone lactonase YvrE n=2 Tax=Thalassovita taeanensis TaxID=657014 RepID=A0A1H9L337_9RHOB|nr:Sugar lactone lactonase YvrE [Thalassovita taeanensis]
MWHPTRGQLFWFDILNRCLLTVEKEQERCWQFDRYVSAAGWVDDSRLLVASETDLFCFDLETGAQESIVALEADNPVTRSNDGCADPWGGFWIGTMGKDLELGAGAIYRYWRGEMRQLKAQMTIPNSICFAPDASCGYYTDTPTQQIMRQPLDPETGWCDGPAELFIDLRDGGFNPDGAVVDAAGCLWSAQWGASRVARYDTDGRFMSAVAFPACQISCPAFGGASRQTLFATSAAEGFALDGRAEGCTFALETNVTGQAEHRVLL